MKSGFLLHKNAGLIKPDESACSDDSFDIPETIEIFLNPTNFKCYYDLAIKRALSKPTTDVYVLPFLFHSVPDGVSRVEVICEEATKSLMYAIQGFPLPFANQTLCKVQPSKTGLGLFAVQDISTGTIVVQERPLLTLPKISVMPPMPFAISKEEAKKQAHDVYLRLLQLAYERLPAHKQAAFMALHDCNTAAEGCGPILGRILTNSVSASPLMFLGPSWLIPESHHDSLHAVLELISRANHSCCPNTRYEFDMPTFSYQLIASRDIVMGEELTLTYCEGLDSRAGRQQTLKSQWRFDCQCEGCSTKWSLESDVRRLALAERDGNWALDILRTWMKDSTLEDDWAISQFQETIDMSNQEGYAEETTLLCLHMLIAKCYEALSQADLAEKAHIKADSIAVAFRLEATKTKYEAALSKIKQRRREFESATQILISGLTIADSNNE